MAALSNIFSRLGDIQKMRTKVIVDEIIPQFSRLLMTFVVFFLKQRIELYSRVFSLYKIKGRK